MAGSVVQERVENECFLAALGGDWPRFGAVSRIEHAWLARGPISLGIGLFSGGCLRPSGATAPESFTPASPPPPPRDRRHPHRERPTPRSAPHNSHPSSTHN